MSSAASSDPTTRYFTVAGSEFGIDGGKYKGKGQTALKAAAKKAALSVYDQAKQANDEVPDKFKMILRETTRNSAKKSFFYDVHIEHLDEPIVLPYKKADGTNVTVTRKVRISKCKSA